MTSQPAVRRIRRKTRPEVDLTSKDTFLSVLEHEGARGLQERGYLPPTPMTGSKRCRCGKTISANALGCRACIEDGLADKIWDKLAAEVASQIVPEGVTMAVDEAKEFLGQLEAIKGRIAEGQKLVQLTPKASEAVIDEENQ